MSGGSVFISYSHKDEAWKERLVTQLRVLELEGAYALWDDRKIAAGGDWRGDIATAMESARAAVLLISANFLISGFIRDNEVPRLLQLRASNGLRVIPLIVRPCPWQAVGWLDPINCRPKDGRPLAKMRNAAAEEALAALALEIRDLLRSRPEVAPRQPAVELPDRFLLQGREYVFVPPGPFTMGSTDARVGNLNKADESEAFSVELPAHEVDLPGFYIARHPVTQTEYAAFVAATGRAVPYRDDELSRPYAWNQERRAPPEDKAEHPVALVSWYDAQAYCQWLGARLPTEAEWEKAARGTDRREWPWGNVWQPGRCNSEEANLGGSTPVGRFSPLGDSPCGAADMAGNVWEWCSSLYATYPYQAGDGREDTAAEGWRVIRGGASGLGRNKVRCAFRIRCAPDDFGFTIGFRAAFDRPPPGAVASPR